MSDVSPHLHIAIPLPKVNNPYDKAARFPQKGVLWYYNAANIESFDLQRR